MATPLDLNARHSRGRVAALGCVYAELDAKSFAGGKAAALAHVEALSPPPSALVDSGGGYHAYWFLAERWELADDAERERARGLQARWVERVGGDPAAKDLARVLRVPGTLNTKYDPPRPVELLYLEEGRRYTVAELEALAPAPVATPPPARSVARALAGSGGPIARFNAEHSVEELLGSYGATRTASGWRCNCGVDHQGPVQLVVTAQGLAVFYSARCRWAPARTDRNGRPYADAFDLFAQVEHGGDKKAAAAALRPARAPRPAEDRPEADAAAHRAQEAARKRQARQAAAQATLRAVRDRAAEDGVLVRRPAERAVLLAMLDVAGDRDWCRPSKARLAEMTGYSLGAVKRAIHELEARGYFTSEGDGGGPNDTAIRTFLRGSPLIHESIENMISESSDLADEGGAVDAPAPEPAEGASFTPQAEAPAPAPRRRPRDFAGLEWHLQQLRALDDYRAEQRAAAPPAEEEATMVPRDEVDPAHAERIRGLERQAWAMLGRAQKATGSARQRSYLRARGQALLDEALALRGELVPAPAPAQEATAPASAPPSPAPQAAQLDLLAYVSQPAPATGGPRADPPSNFKKFQPVTAQRDPSVGARLSLEEHDAAIAAALARGVSSLQLLRERRAAEVQACAD